MGEEAAGVDAVRVAHARIAAGQSEIALVGGAHNGERKDLLLLYEFGGLNLKETFAPVWQRAAKPGFALGSLGAFLVIESRRHAEARGAKAVARLAAVLSDRSRREPGAVTESLRRLWRKIAPRLDPNGAAVISGATGVEPATAEERAFLAEHSELAVRGTATQIGHGFEPQFPMNLALAAIAVQRGSLFAPGDPTFEQPMSGPLRRVIVTAVGHWRGEGMALVEAL
jgi:3-oxoacyl-[acyl-carrier-protein] synthase II